MSTQTRGNNSPCATAAISIGSGRGLTRPASQSQGPQAQGALRRNNESISPSLTFTASHNGPSTEHGWISPEHPHPRCTQLCRKFAAEGWFLGVAISVQKDSTPHQHSAQIRLCHMEKHLASISRSRTTFVWWVYLCLLISLYRVG